MSDKERHVEGTDQSTGTTVGSSWKTPQESRDARLIPPTDPEKSRRINKNTK